VVFDRPALVTVAVLVGTVAAYLLGADLAFTAVAGFTLLLVVHRSEGTALWSQIDWSVILFFGGLFVVVEALVQSGGAAWALARLPLVAAAPPEAASFGATLLGHFRTASIFLVGSNVVSNVPFILVIAPDLQRAAGANPTLMWELLAMASTFAGNLTLLGSVANIIVAERWRALGTGQTDALSFMSHLRVGLPLALATTAMGTVWLVLVHGVFG
jgi:Na+/H+ antiporter NhaD/arsenite permease-like protein